MSYKSYQAINNTKSVLLPEKGTFIFMQNFKRWTKAPFILYGGFECVLTPSADNINFGPNTEKHQGHTVYSYGYKLICVDERYSKPCKTYIHKDTAD